MLRRPRVEGDWPGCATTVGDLEMGCLSLENLKRHNGRLLPSGLEHASEPPGRHIKQTRARSRASES